MLSCHLFVVTLDHFKNVQDVFIHEPAALLCTSSPDTSVLWFYQKYCDDFEYGLYQCLSQEVPVAVGDEYQTNLTAPGEHNLLINSVRKNMTGLYSCAVNENEAAIYSVLLNVMCKHLNFVLILYHFYVFYE